MIPDDRDCGGARRYGRRVWLTEYAVGRTADRAANDAFMKASLPLLLASDAVMRFAWCVRARAHALRKHVCVRNACALACGDCSERRRTAAPCVQVRSAQPGGQRLGECIKFAAVAAAIAVGGGHSQKQGQQQKKNNNNNNHNNTTTYIAACGSRRPVGVHL